MDENVIEVENLVKYFDGRCVLDGINLKVPWVLMLPILENSRTSPSC